MTLLGFDIAVWNISLLQTFNIGICIFFYVLFIYKMFTVKNALTITIIGYFSLFRHVDRDRYS